MQKSLIILLLILSILVSDTLAIQQISYPLMQIKDNDIIVNFALLNVKKLKETLDTGVAREFIFTIELMRLWRFWPDEFVVSKRIRETVQYDILRRQYSIVSTDGELTVKRRVRGFQQLSQWIFANRTVNLANIKELDPGTYYIRVIVESRTVEKVPLIGHLIYLLPEKEVSMVARTKPFAILSGDWQ